MTDLHHLPELRKTVLDLARRQGQTLPVWNAGELGSLLDILAGMVPLDAAATLKAVRHGQGTPALSRHARKVCWIRG